VLLFYVGSVYAVTLIWDIEPDSERWIARNVGSGIVVALSSCACTDPAIEVNSAAKKMENRTFVKQQFLRYLIRGAIRTHDSEIITVT
jgi:hypothetical protein